MPEDTTPPVPPVTERPETQKSESSESRLEAGANAATSTDRNTAQSETTESQSDEISKAQALMNGVKEFAGQIVDGVSSLAKQAGDAVKVAGVAGLVAGAGMIHPMGDVAQLADEVSSVGGPTIESGPTAGTTANTIGEHGGTLTTAGGEKVEYAFAAPAEKPEPKPEENPMQELGTELDHLADEVDKSLQERDEQLAHPVIEGEFKQ